MVSSLFLCTFANRLWLKDEVVKEYVVAPYITNNWCSDQENYSENNFKIKDVTKYIADYLAVYLSEEADMWVAVSKRMKDKQ